MTIGLIIVTIFFYVKMLIAYDTQSNKTVSYERNIKYYNSNTSQTVSTFTYDNFSLAVGFYVKPNTSFVNVSQFVSSAAGVKISAYQTRLVRSNGSLMMSEV